MSWKEKLKLKKFVINEEVDNYLISNGFRYSEMPFPPHMETRYPVECPCLELCMPSMNEGYMHTIIAIDRFRALVIGVLLWETEKRLVKKTLHLENSRSFDIEKIDTILNSIV